MSGYVRRFDWHRLDSQTETAHNGRPLLSPGSLRAYVWQWPSHGYQAVYTAPSWPKPFYGPYYDTAAESTEIAERVLMASLDREDTVPRDEMSALIAQATAAASRQEAEQ